MPFNLLYRPYLQPLFKWHKYSFFVPIRLRMSHSFELSCLLSRLIRSLLQKRLKSLYFNPFYRRPCEMSSSSGHLLLYPSRRMRLFENRRRFHRCHHLERLRFLFHLPKYRFLLKFRGIIRLEKFLPFH